MIEGATSLGAAGGKRNPLHEGDSRNRAILRAIPDLMFVIDRFGTYLDYHAGDASELLVEPDQFIGKNVRDVLPPDIAQKSLHSIEQALDSHEPVSLEYSLPLHGELRFYEARIVAFDPQKVLTIVRDVTARRRAEDALEETRRFNRRITETIPIVIFVYDLEQRRCIYINDRIKAVLGYSAEDVIAMGDRFLWPAMHPDDRWTVHDPLGGCAAANSSEAIERVFRVRHRNGEWRWVHCMATVFARFEDGRAKQILGTFTDVTALKRAEQELHSLSTRLLEVEETEQRRIARELHDGTAQLLFAIGANLANMRKLTGLPANVIGTLGDCQALVDECLKEVRSLSYLLHHPLLEQAGLPAALEWVAEGFSQRSGIDVELKIDASLERLPLPLERHLFRVVQEGLGNVARHSGSRKAILRLERVDDHVRLLIQDFGRGMPAVSSTGSDDKVLGVGIPGMRDRLRHIGGHLNILSSGQGTTLEVIVPVYAENPEPPRPPGRPVTDS